MVLPQLEKTPERYSAQFEASTQIETGPSLTAFFNDYVSSFSSMTHGLPEFKNFFAVGVSLQVPLWAVYAYSSC